MKRLFVACTTTVLLAGCGTQMKVGQIDETTGLIKTDVGTVTKATVVTAKKVPSDQFRSLAFISGGGEYGVEQLKAIKYFNQVVNYDGLQKIVIANNLQEKVPSLNEPIGLNKLYRAYKPFLWIHFKRTQNGNKPFLQIIATNPETMDDVFVSEVHLDFIWAGVNDQNARYPLFNALVEWLRQNG